MAASTKMGLGGPMGAYAAADAGTPPDFGTGLHGYQNRGRGRVRLWWLVLGLIGQWWI